MDICDKSLLEARILKNIYKIFADRGIDRKVNPEDTLTDAGFSSLDMLNLMLAMEAEFNIVVPQREITTENFKSVFSIEAMLERLLSKPAAV